MPSPPAIRPDTVYHIFSRGNNRENIFIEERNYAYFLDLYLKHVAPYVLTYGYCFMKNHFHLLVYIKTILASPSQQFANLLNAYTKAINKAYDRTGSLFQNPFGRVQVLNQAHLLQSLRYIHLNPQRHGFVEDFRDWPYTSYHPLLSDEPTFLAKDEVLAMFGGRRELIRFHQAIPESFETLLYRAAADT